MNSNPHLSFLSMKDKENNLKYTKNGIQLAKAKSHYNKELHVNLYKLIYTMVFCKELHLYKVLPMLSLQFSTVFYIYCNIY